MTVPVKLITNDQKMVVDVVEENFNKSVCFDSFEGDTISEALLYAKRYYVGKPAPESWWQYLKCISKMP